MVGQGGGPGVVRVLAVGGEEVVGEVGTPEAFEVHGQEGHVGEAVAQPQRGVELEAVEHPGPVREAEDVVGQQVAVAVAGPALGHPAREQRRSPDEVALGEAVDGADVVGVEDAGHSQHLPGVGRPAGSRGVAARGLVRRRAGSRAMERRQQVGEVPEVAGDVRTGADQGGEAPVGGHAPHDDQVVARLPVGPGHVGHPEVHVGRQPAVELHLAVAGQAPGVPGAEVEEPQVDRLLHLVGPVAEEDHHRSGSRAPARAAVQQASSSSVAPRRRGMAGPNGTSVPRRS